MMNIVLDTNALLNSFYHKMLLNEPEIVYHRYSVKEKTHNS